MIRGNIIAEEFGENINAVSFSDKLTVVLANGKVVKGTATVRGSNGGSFLISQEGDYEFMPGLEFNHLGPDDSTLTAMTCTIGNAIHDWHETTLELVVTRSQSGSPASNHPDQPNLTISLKSADLNTKNPESDSFLGIEERIHRPSKCNSDSNCDIGITMKNQTDSDINPLNLL